jgi:hypothetical protein
MPDHPTIPQYMALITSELSDETKLKIMYQNATCIMMFGCDIGHLTEIIYPQLFVDLMAELDLEFAWVKGFMFRFPNDVKLTDSDFVLLTNGNYSSRYFSQIDLDIESLVFLLKCKNPKFDERTIQKFELPPTTLSTNTRTCLDQK